MPIHSHNDYQQKQPLAEALKHRVKSIEADVFLVDDELCVAHFPHQIRKEKTLAKMYLEPLFAHFQKNKDNDDELFLMIDIKRDGEKVFPLLEKMLLPYGEMLTKYENGIVHKKPVRIILSGNRPLELMAQQKSRFSFADGRISPNENNFADENFTPMYSNNWKKIFTWNGKGTFPEREKIVLDKLSKEAENQGIWLRFWNTPSSSKSKRKNMTNLLKQYPNILIGTDHIEETSTYYRQK
ncbi:MAG: hypothetical protein Q4G08_02335 [Capnocytophaga sp.]|nr:hypothetical protein [Capnocytophaga sp.]